MRTVRLIVRYEGTGLSGWQRQRGVATVQEALEAAASTMARERVRVHGAGRTDAGVHALAQVAAFRTDARIPEQGWRLGLNATLPPQVAVREARFAQDDFDPRRAAGGKRYRYLFLTAPDRDPLLRDRAWHLHGRLDLDLLDAEARSLVGTHDYRAFRASDCDRRNTVRRLFRVELLRGYAGRADLLALELEGTAFLKNMVRVIAGTLIDIARGRLPPGTVAARLTDGDRTLAGITAPPHGLYLDEVFLRPEWRLPDDVLRSHGYPLATDEPNPVEDTDAVDDG